jgi:hypothetical protein
MQVIFMTLFRGKDCFLVKAVMRYSIRKKAVQLR